MKTTVILAALVLASGIVACMAPVKASSISLPACVDPKGMYGPTQSCGGLACADKNLDHKFSGDECVYFLCPEYGCCYCPPPQWM